MFKKKFIEFFFISVLVLFIGLFSTSYAYNYTITDADIDTIFTAHNMGSTWNNLKSYCKNYKDTIYQTYDTCVIALNYYSSRYYIYIYGFDADDVTTVTNANNANYMTITLSANGAFYQLSPNTQNYSQISVTSNTTWTGGQFGTGAQKRTKYLVVPNDLGNNLFSGPWQSSEVLTFTPPTPVVDFVVELYDNSLSSVRVQNWSSYVYYASKDYLNTGVLSYFTPFRQYDYSELDYIIKQYFVYDFYNQYWYLSSERTIKDFSSSGDYYIDSENDVIYIRENKNQRADIIEKIFFIPKSDNFIGTYECIYYGSLFTYKSGDYISMTSTFGDSSGDSNSYYDNYNSQNNSSIIDHSFNNIEDTLTSPANIDNIVSSVSGDSEYILNQLGYVPLENPFLEFIRWLVNGLLSCITSDNSNVSLNFTLFGHSYTFTPSQFATPNSVLTTLLSSILTFVILYNWIKYMFNFVKSIVTLDLSAVLNKSNNTVVNDNEWRSL